MTTTLKLSGVTLPAAAYPKMIDFTGPDLPVKTGLVGLYQLGGTLEDSLVNLVGGAPATAIGDPTVSSFGASLTPSNCIDTGLGSAAAITYIVVAKPVLYTETGINACAVGNYWTDSATTEGDSLFFWNTAGTTNILRQFADVNAASTAQAVSTVTLTGASSAEWNFFAGKSYGATKSKAAWGKSGSLTFGAEGTQATARAVNTSRKIRIGGHHAGTAFGAPFTAALVAIYHAELSDAQITAVYDYLRTTWAPAFGVTTL